MTKKKKSLRARLNEAEAKMLSVFDLTDEERRRKTAAEVIPLAYDEVLIVYRDGSWLKAKGKTSDNFRNASTDMMCVQHVHAMTKMGVMSEEEATKYRRDAGKKDQEAGVQRKIHEVERLGYEVRKK